MMSFDSLTRLSAYKDKKTSLIPAKFGPVGFIDNDVLPCLLSKFVLILHEYFEACQQDLQQ